MRSAAVDRSGAIAGLLAACLLSCALGCSDEAADGEGGADLSAAFRGPSDGATAVEVEVPEAPRSFRMGLGAHPYDPSDAAEQALWNAIGTRADLVAVVLDDGVPWAELVDGAAFPEALEQDLAALEARLAQVSAELYLAADLFAPDRAGIAGDVEGRPLPSGFAGASAGEPAVTAAYTAYCERLLERFEPVYFSPVLDLNLYLLNRPADYAAAEQAYKDLREHLKALYPSTQIFPTWNLEVLAGLGPVSDERQFDEMRMLDANSDRLGISVLPASQNLSVAALPSDHINRLEPLTARDIVIVAAAYPSSGFELGGASFASSDASQHNFLAFLLGSIDAEDDLASTGSDRYDFVVWQYPFDVAGDLEALCPRRIAAPETGCEEDARFDAVRPHASAGLARSNGTPRLVAGLWDAYFGRTYEAGE